MNGSQAIALLFVAGYVGWLLNEQRHRDRDARLELAQEIDALRSSLVSVRVKVDEIAFGGTASPRPVEAVQPS